MELAGEKPRMFVAREFYNLYELLVSRRTAEDQSAFFQRRAIRGIEFVTMAVALTNLFRAAVNFTRQRTFAQKAGPRAEPHRTAELLDVDQISQLENNRMRRFDIELS